MATWVPVLVRVEDYPEITQLIAAREASRRDEPPVPVADVRGLPAPATAAGPGQEQIDRHIPWSVADLQKLARGETITTQRWARALDVCADAGAGVWLPTPEVAQRAGMTVNEWRDAPRKITRHLRAHYPDAPRNDQGEAWWPLCVRGEAGQAWWAITEEMKNRWHQVRAS